MKATGLYTERSIDIEGDRDEFREVRGRSINIKGHRDEYREVNGH